jgi:hypothetical protein
VGVVWTTSLQLLIVLQSFAGVVNFVGRKEREWDDGGGGGDGGVLQEDLDRQFELRL